MLVLGFDTSTPSCTVALCEVTRSPAGVACLARREMVDARRHGELLAPLIQETISSAGHTPARLEAIVVGVGPGPYTSLRVGIVTAAAFADALGIPAYGICSLDGLAPQSGPAVTVATDARRREVYWARYAAGRRIGGPGVALPATVAGQLEAGEHVIGAGGELYAEVFNEAFDGAFDDAAGRFPDPVRLIELSAHLLGSPAGPLVPLYLRRPDATPRAAA